ncbi:ParB/RepB/Spo0J family partition protein [Marininema halotolerans]|uniref:Chromosome partitioning protein, ParB family n=1 Tax=Marininema halotolerans TaxID=1155944 RepID=A0A1I6PAH7_9BACL|nr:ParB/RepB/Spo0J family partition protein [Marininema halotolerans]SFS37222.1 chromosome partitioning protein, ParB family [Marininema halotolerans]
MASKGLGKGLDALFPTAQIEENESFNEVSITELRPNPYQPRKHFDAEALEELMASIQEHGIVQPLVVRKSIRGYEIVAGERRFRAGKEVGLAKVPVVIREFSDEQMMEIALIENLQREDLNSMEIAQAYKKLQNHLSITQEELAVRVGKSRPHVANFLRLLQLPVELQESVSRGTLSMGHARALLGVKDREMMLHLAQKVEKEDASVRQLEEWVQQTAGTLQPKKKNKKREETPSAYKRYEDLLQEAYSTPVRIRQGRKKGRIEIEYYSQRELERLVEILHKDRIID